MGMSLVGQKIRLLMILGVLNSLSCSGLQTPEYKGPGSVSKREPAQSDEPSDYDEGDGAFDGSSEEVKRGSSQHWGFDWPVDSARFSRGFNTTSRRPHLGIDLASAKGTPIYSAHTGRVLYAGRDFRGYGNLIILESDQGWATLYAHLEKILVREGQVLGQGDLMGRMGRTGHASGVHLHFELRKNKAPIDPIPYLPGGKEMLSGLPRSHQTI